MDPSSHAETAQTTDHVRRAREGSADSLVWLVERFTPLLLAQARHRLSPRLRAEVDPADLVQHAWMVCLPRLFPLALGHDREQLQLTPREGHLTGPLLRYLSQTLLRAHNDLLKSRARRPKKETQGAASRHPVEDLGASEEVVARALRGESARQLLACLDQLSEKGREIIVLRGIEGLPYEHLAEKLGASEAALRQRLRHATDKLRRCVLEDYLDELAAA